jgi:hypothetical protein
MSHKKENGLLELFAKLSPTFSFSLADFTSISQFSAICRRICQIYHLCFEKMILFSFYHVRFTWERTWSTCCVKLVVGMGMSNGPIRAKQVNPSSSVIGGQNRGQTDTSECTVAQCSCIHSTREWTAV